MRDLSHEVWESGVAGDLDDLFAFHFGDHIEQLGAQDPNLAHFLAEFMNEFGCTRGLVRAAQNAILATSTDIPGSPRRACPR